MAKFLPKTCPQAFLLGGFSFALVIAFWPMVHGGYQSARWALVAAGAPLAATCVKMPDRSAGATLGLFLLGYATFSLVWTPDRYQGALTVLEWCFLGGAFYVGMSIAGLGPVIACAAAGLGVSMILAIMQAGGFDGIPQNTGPAGLFSNKNYLGEIVAMVLAGAVALRMTWAIPLLAPALVLSECRGAWLGLAAACFVALWGWSRRCAVAVALVGALAVGAYTLHRGWHHGDWTTRDMPRANLLADTVAGLTWTGSGVGSYYARFPSHIHRFDVLEGRPAHAHNDVLELVYDLGPGALLALLLVGFALLAPLQPERMILAAFLVEGLFGFPLHNPCTAALAALVLGRLCAHGPDLRRVLAACRMVAGESGSQAVKLARGDGRA